MSLKKIIDKNVSLFLKDVDKSKSFGVSDIQRICDSGYNKACHTLEEMKIRNLIEEVGIENCEYKWSFK